MSEFRYMTIDELEEGREVEVKGGTGQFVGFLYSSGPSKWSVVSNDPRADGMGAKKSGYAYSYHLCFTTQAETRYPCRYVDEKPVPKPKKPKVRRKTEIIEHVGDDVYGPEGFNGDSIDKLRAVLEFDIANRNALNKKIAEDRRRIAQWERFNEKHGFGSKA